MTSTKQWRNDSVRYGTISRILHWLMAALIIIMLCLGWGMDFMPNEWRSIAIGIHKSLGISILLLACTRLAWRLYNSPPKLPTFMPPWEKCAGIAVHYFLYGLLFAMPLSGWAMISAKGRPIVFLGIIPLPPLIASNHETGKWLENIHSDLAYLLAITIALHAAAALHHHFIRKDSVLTRMWPTIAHKKEALRWA